MDDFCLVDLLIKERKFLFVFIKFCFKVGFIGKDCDLLEIYYIYNVFIDVK